MPFYDTTTQDAALEALWPTTGPSPLFADTSFEFGLLTSDPRATGTVDEMPADGSAAATCWAIFAGGLLRDFGRLDGSLTFTGYARLTIPNDGSFWLAASGGEKDSAPQTFTGAAETVTATVRFNSQAA